MVVGQMQESDRSVSVTDVGCGNKEYSELEEILLTLPCSALIYLFVKKFFLSHPQMPVVL